MTTNKDVDTYISRQPENVQQILQKIRGLVHEIAPGATEVISYGIPTFDLNGKHLIHFAGFKKHVSLFPTSSGVEVFKDELESYATSRGTIQFPLDKSIPYELIRKITKFRANQILSNK